MIKGERIDQVLESFGRHDAIGNEVLLMRSLLREAGYLSDIYANAGADGKDILPAAKLFDSADERKLIHHFSIASNLVYRLIHSPWKQILRYHNITPAYFFAAPEMHYTRMQCMIGRAQLPFLRNQCQTFWAASEFNAQDLRGLGFESGIVLPVMRHYDHLLTVKGDESIISSLKNSGTKTILFVGRVNPNKCQHDLLFLLHQYKKHYAQKVRLVLLGGLEPFYGAQRMPKLCKELNLTYRVLGKRAVDPTVDVSFVDGADEHCLVSYYRAADVFVCMSEHEGFGVPLIEAMGFDLPILAHPAAAVPETLGGAGIVVDKADRPRLLSTLDSLLSDIHLRQTQIELGRRRLADFEFSGLREKFLQATSAI